MSLNPTVTPIPVAPLVESRLQKIWTDPRFRKFSHRDFLAPNHFLPGALLFVGINPSYTEADAAIRYYDPHRGDHRYFRPFKDLAHEAGHFWSHLDLLYHRETSQQSLSGLLRQPNGRDFVWEQLRLFPTLLAAAQPAIILVCNAKARTFMGLDQHHSQEKWLDLAFEWDEQLGTYRYKGIPTFFSSMLGGSGALDRGSRQRLTWQIKRALALR